MAVLLVDGLPVDGLEDGEAGLHFGLLPEVFQGGIEHWRVQVRLGGSDSPLRTFELRREPLSEQRLLETITDN